MAVAHTSHVRIEKHAGPHRTAHIENFTEPLHFGIRGGIKDFHQNKYGREIKGTEYPTTRGCNCRGYPAVSRGIRNRSVFEV